MADALAVLISVRYMLYTPTMSEKIFTGVYLAVDALDHLRGFLYVLYTPSLNAKIFNGVIYCGRL